MRTHRHRHATTAAIPAAATHTTPSRPDGTPTEAPGTPAAHRATRSSHHNSGPVNRINSCAPDGHSGHSAAAVVPTTVIGGISSATWSAGQDARYLRKHITGTSREITGGMCDCGQIVGTMWAQGQLELVGLMAHKRTSPACAWQPGYRRSKSAGSWGITRSRRRSALCAPVRIRPLRRDGRSTRRDAGPKPSATNVIRLRG